MTDSKKSMEAFLQKYRFRMVMPYLKGDVMDFGGNEGELKQFVRGNYVCVNCYHSVTGDKKFDTIVALAVIEHIHVEDVFSIFSKFKEKHLKPEGIVFLTTPTKIAKPLLESMAAVGILDKANIDEHKHYWSKKDIYQLAEKTGLHLKKHKKFQIGFNQLAILSNE